MHNMSKIVGVLARQVLDSRGNPTVEAEIKTGDGFFRGMVPSGASTGIHEALELRDKDEARYSGKGVLEAVGNIKNVIAPKIKGLNATSQREIDGLMCELDGTDNKKNLGANAILAVSMAVCRAGAAAEGKKLFEYIAGLSGKKGVTLPVPQLNVINGGEHAGMENDIQENMYMPLGAESFGEAIRMGAETYHTLKKMIKKHYGPLATQLGDEGGFVPPIEDPRERLDLLMSAAAEAGYESDMAVAIDAASSEFYYADKNIYMIGDEKYSAGELVDFYKDLASTYPLVSLEDGMAEDDWEGWKLLNQQLGDKIQLTGDDLLVTNVGRIGKAVSDDVCNALLLKVNQIGSITESIAAAEKSYDAGWGVTVSHRSGETEDSFIADLAVGLDTGQIKTGAPARSERLSKYNQLIRIEQKLAGEARYLGVDFMVKS
ncbi:MAG: phosphopyruvate hydratase [Candidatus Altiarchaeales archaeon]|nr:phosphopyruvate hydratase [Candidatus Altiarchaeales archaeon]